MIISSIGYTLSRLPVYSIECRSRRTSDRVATNSTTLTMSQLTTSRARESTVCEILGADWTFNTELNVDNC